jgi:uncharacterized protein DUF6515
MRRTHRWLFVTALAVFVLSAVDASALIVVGRPWGMRARCWRCGYAVPAYGGFAAGALLGAEAEAAAKPVVAQPTVGTAVGALPPGCQQMNVNGQNYYQCAATWYRPYFGAGGVYYEVVPVP